MGNLNAEEVITATTNPKRAEASDITSSKSVIETVSGSHRFKIKGYSLTKATPLQIMSLISGKVMGSGKIYVRSAKPSSKVGKQMELRNFQNANSMISSSLFSTTSLQFDVGPSLGTKLDFVNIYRHNS